MGREIKAIEKSASFATGHMDMVNGIDVREIETIKDGIMLGGTLDAKKGEIYTYVWTTLVPEDVKSKLEEKTLEGGLFGFIRKQFDGVLPTDGGKTELQGKVAKGELTGEAAQAFKFINRFLTWYSTYNASQKKEVNAEEAKKAELELREKAIAEAKASGVTDETKLAKIGDDAVKKAKQSAASQKKHNNIKATLEKANTDEVRRALESKLGFPIMKPRTLDELLKETDTALILDRLAISVVEKYADFEAAQMLKAAADKVRADKSEATRVAHEAEVAANAPAESPAEVVNGNVH